MPACAAGARPAGTGGGDRRLHALLWAVGAGLNSRRLRSRLYSHNVQQRQQPSPLRGDHNVPYDLVRCRQQPRGPQFASSRSKLKRERASLRPNGRLRGIERNHWKVGEQYLVLLRRNSAYEPSPTQ